MEQTTKESLWQKSKLLLKGLLIGALSLLLLIPAYFVRDLIEERETRQKEAIAEVSGRWAGSQQVLAPVLVVPYWETVEYSNGSNESVRRLAYVLPDKLRINGQLKPEQRHRGIYDIMLYSSDLQIDGRFDPLPLQQLQLSADKVIWNEAYVAMGVTDARGLREELQLKWNDSVYTLNPARFDTGFLKEGFSTPVSLAPGQTTTFSAQVKLQGSGQLLFLPTGKSTDVKLSSVWKEPSFSGASLPDYTLNDGGFTAQWKSLAHTRNFPQAWKNQTYQLQSAAMGVDLFIPVNGYQKTMRSVKYALLCIVLTFAAFFLVETAGKRSVHPLHYGLVGVALILFYTLLLSVSEYAGFDIAYIVAAAATIGLITLFLKSVLQSGKLAAVMALVLALQYGYIFVVLQLQDSALLVGSIGLFVVLAVIMYFSRRIKW
ncbi:MAG: cell envelope integrity protein CreD [Chitinophagaceae bacterium]